MRFVPCTHTAFSFAQLAMPAISFDDVPVLPTVATFLQYFDLETLLELGKRIVAALQRRGEHVSETEAQQLNVDFRKDIQKTFDRMTDKISSAFGVQPGENSEVARDKIAVIKQCVKYINDLGIWLIEKISAILSEIKEFFQWCWQAAQELFQYLHTMLSGN